MIQTSFTPQHVYPVSQEIFARSSFVKLEFVVVVLFEGSKLKGLLLLKKTFLGTSSKEHSKLKTFLSKSIFFIEDLL